MKSKTSKIKDKSNNNKEIQNDIIPSWALGPLKTNTELKEKKAEDGYKKIKKYSDFDRILSKIAQLEASIKSQRSSKYKLDFLLDYV